VRLIFDQTPTGAIYVTNVRLSSQIGGGAATYPPIPPPAAPVTPPPAPASSAAPIEYPASIVSINQVTNAPELNGADGYRILIQSSSGGFPARDEGLVMIIGDGAAPLLTNAQTFTAGYDPLIAGQRVFTLTTSQFQGLSSGKRVIVQFGQGPPLEYWNCGTLP